jgi:hypothetical protein
MPENHGCLARGIQKRGIHYTTVQILGSIIPKLKTKTNTIKGKKKKHCVIDVERFELSLSQIQR